MSRIAPVLSVIIFLALWKLYIVGANVSTFVLPAPERVAAGVIELLREKETYYHIYVTLFEIAIGFLLALIFGTALGILLSKMPVLDRALRPLLVTLQVIPKVALAPLLILWFGFGPESKILISAVLGFFPIFTNTMLGMKSVERGHREVMASLRASRSATLYMVELPSALPHILTGMEVGIVLSTVGAVVGEFLGGNAGLGSMAVIALTELRVERLFGVIVLLTALGFILSWCVTLLQHVAIPWHESQLPRTA